jgi:hypothetical protein
MAGSEGLVVDDDESISSLCAIAIIALDASVEAEEDEYFLLTMIGSKYLRQLFVQLQNAAHTHTLPFVSIYISVLMHLQLKLVELLVVDHPTAFLH